jgi:hypothetical protein
MDDLDLMKIKMFSWSNPNRQLLDGWLRGLIGFGGGATKLSGGTSSRPTRAHRSSRKIKLGDQNVMGSWPRRWARCEELTIGFLARWGSIKTAGGNKVGPSNFGDDDKRQRSSASIVSLQNERGMMSLSFLRSRFSSGSRVPTRRWRGRRARVWGLQLKQRGDGAQLLIGKNWVMMCGARTHGSFYLRPRIWFESSRILESVSTVSSCRGNFPCFDF